MNLKDDLDERPNPTGEPEPGPTDPSSEPVGGDIYTDPSDGTD